MILSLLVVHSLYNANLKVMFIGVSWERIKLKALDSTSGGFSPRDLGSSPGPVMSKKMGTCEGRQRWFCE